MAEVILTADRLTQAEAKKVSKDLIGEVAPNFLYLTMRATFFESSTLDGSWRIVFFYAGWFTNMQARMFDFQRTA